MGAGRRLALEIHGEVAGRWHGVTQRGLEGLSLKAGRIQVALVWEFSHWQGEAVGTGGWDREPLRSVRTSQWLGCQAGWGQGWEGCWEGLLPLRFGSWSPGVTLAVQGHGWWVMMSFRSGS